MIVIGAIFGACFGGVHSQSFGRRNTILASIVLSMVGISCILYHFLLRLLHQSYMFGSHHAFLFIGQFIIGFAAQYLGCAIPAYTSEICQPRVRKLSGTFFITFFSFGSAFMFLLLALFTVPVAMEIILVLTILNFILVTFCPKSPTWLIQKGHRQEAFEILASLRGCEIVAKEELERLENKVYDLSKKY